MRSTADPAKRAPPKARTDKHGARAAGERSTSSPSEELVDRFGNRRGLARMALQRQRRPGAESAGFTPAVTRALEAPGVPLRSQTKADFEAAFGADFGDVRLHGGDAPAREAANDLGARAFTAGEHIVLGEGDPADAAPELLAHELAHVLQQRRGEVPPGGIDDGGSDPLEHAADRAASRAIAGSGPPALQSAKPSPAPRAIQRQEDGDAQTKIRRILADSDAHGVLALTSEEIATTTPAQRAGLIHVLLGLTWAGEAEETRMVFLLRHGAQVNAVMTYVDAIGDRSRLIEAVDDEELALALRVLLSSADRGTGPVADAIASNDAAQVMALSVSDLATATDLQRLGLLRILIDMSWSNETEEMRMVEILESSGGGRGTLVENLKALGLKQRLFDHVDGEGPRRRLAAALGSVGDAEINADLAVQEQGFFTNLWAGLSGGAILAYENFSLGDVLMGLLRPIIHPIDSIVELFDELVAIFQDPSVDRVITFARDLCGFIGAWLMVLALVAWGVDAAAAAGVITIPASIPLTVIAAGLTAWAEFFGIAYIVLAAVRLVWNLGEAGAATTARELEHEQEELGEDVTAVGIGLIFLGIARLLKVTLNKLRQSAVDPNQANPNNLERIAAQDEALRARAAGRARAAEEAARRGDPAPEPEPEPEAAPPVDAAPPVPDDLRAAREALDHPDARAEFDRILADSAGDAEPYFRARRAFNGMRRGEGGLEAQLLRRAGVRAAARARAEPRGGGAEPLREVDADARFLIDQLEANQAIPGVARLLARLRDALEGPIREMMEGRVEATPERVAGERNNVEAVWEEWRAAQEHGGAVGLGQRFALRPGEAPNVDVDVVAEDGRAWIEVKNERPFGTHAADATGRMTAQPHPVWAARRAQVLRLLEAARNNPLPNGTRPRLVVRFPQGVSFAVLRGLEALGVQVEGPVVVDIGARPPGIGAAPARSGEDDEERAPN